MYAHILLDKHKEPSDLLEDLLLKIEDSKKVTLLQPPGMWIKMWKTSAKFSHKVLRSKINIFNCISFQSLMN
jgi:hypothetical protein